MGKFIKKIIIYICIPILGYLAVFYLIKIKVEREIDTKEILLLGDSQTEFINHPEIYNNSISGSPFFAHFEILRDLDINFQNKKIVYFS